MPVAPSDIQYRRAGTTGLGGAKSATVLTASTVIDDITSAEAAAGDIEYRCVYVHNANASMTLSNAVAWLAANTPSTSTNVEIGLGTSAVSGTEQTIADEATAPAGVSFSVAANLESAIVLGNLGPGQSRAVWIKRTVAAGAPAAASDGFTIRVEGDS